MELMYSEKDKAEYLLKNGFINREYKYQQALWVAKYFRHILGYGDAKIKTELIKFCEVNADFFHKDAKGIRGSIKRVVRKSKTPMLNTVVPISITKSEIEVIQSVKNFKWQKILIAMVLVAKLGKRNIVWTNEWRKVRLILGRWATNKKIRDVIFYCDKVNIIGITDNKFHNFTFIDDSSDPLITVYNEKEIRNFEKIYTEYCGGEIRYCSVCGDSFIKTGGRNRYCETHRKEKELERKRNWWKKKD